MRNRGGRRKFIPQTIIESKDFDPYDAKYNYEEMKIICVLCKLEICLNLDYEHLCKAARAIYGIWHDGMDHYAVASDKLLHFRTKEEEGYIQAYAERIGEQFIKDFFEGEIDNV